MLLRLEWGFKAPFKSKFQQTALLQNLVSLTAKFRVALHSARSPVRVLWRQQRPFCWCEGIDPGLAELSTTGKFSKKTHP